LRQCVWTLRQSRYSSAEQCSDELSDQNHFEDFRSDLLENACGMGTAVTDLISVDENDLPILAFCRTLPLVEGCEDDLQVRYFDWN
jgi:hypothetical protein